MGTLIQMQAKVEQQLVDFPQALELVQGCFDPFTTPFSGLESHYKQQKFFQENFGLQVSPFPLTMYTRRPAHTQTKHVSKIVQLLGSYSCKCG